MTAEIVNLRRARKAKARATDAATATANRALHGRSQASQVADEKAQARRTRLLDGAKRTDD